MIKKVWRVTFQRVGANSHVPDMVATQWLVIAATIQDAALAVEAKLSNDGDRAAFVNIEYVGTIMAGD